MSFTIVIKNYHISSKNFWIMEQAYTTQDDSTLE